MPTFQNHIFDTNYFAFLYKSRCCANTHKLKSSLKGKIETEVKANIDPSSNRNMESSPGMNIELVSNLKIESLPILKIDSLSNRNMFVAQKCSKIFPCKNFYKQDSKLRKFLLFISILMESHFFDMYCWSIWKLCCLFYKRYEHTDNRHVWMANSVLDIPKRSGL